MRLRLGLLTGFAAGYVLGAKAGRERYEEIRQQFDKLMGTEPAQQLQSEVRQAAERASSLFEEKATEGIDRVADKVGEKVGGNKSSSSNSGTTAEGITLPPA